MLLRKEEKFRKHINGFSDWKKQYLEAVYPHYNRYELPLLQPMIYDFCAIVVSSVTITNAI
jgi:hypothetical protein